MFKVLMLNENEFVIMAGKRALYGDAKKTVYALSELGIDIAEIEYGLMDMVHKGNNVAEYGINYTFLFSTKVGNECVSVPPNSKRVTNYTEAMDEFQESFIFEAIELCGGNISEVCRRFGVNRKTVYSILKRRRVDVKRAS